MRSHKIERFWKYKGLDCVCMAINLGHRCGYVRIPEGNRFYGLSCYDKFPKVKVNLNRSMGDSLAKILSFFGREDLFKNALCTVDGVIDIHGGVTFTEHTDFNDVEGFWIGFDCNHYEDGKDFSLITDAKTRALYADMENGKSAIKKTHIWTTEDVVRECEKLAEQIVNEKGNYEISEIKEKK